MTLKGFKKDFIEMAQIFIPAILISWVITTFFIANTVVPSSSMEPTIMPGSRICGNRLAYKFGKKPERGEIIIFNYPDNPKVKFIKRLIGLPGDIVEIKEDENKPGFGFVYINGELLDEPYLKEKMEILEDLRFEVPDDHYLFLGDNRNHSNDARYWENTYVSRDNLVAKAVFQYWKGFKNFNEF